MADFLLFLLLIFLLSVWLTSRDKEQNLQRNQLIAHGLT